MEQFSRLTAKVAFQMKFDGSRGRAVNVKVGDVFLVTNPKHDQTRGIKIDRKNKAGINSGYLLTLEQIQTLFTFGG
jgi:hypothetical protein